VTGRQISQACHVAQQHRDHRLALLLSQATGNSSVRYLLQKQLSDWEQIKVIIHSVKILFSSKSFLNSFGNILFKLKGKKKIYARRRYLELWKSSYWNFMGPLRGCTTNFANSGMVLKITQFKCTTSSQLK
jgi:hypothetical protein